MKHAAITSLALLACAAPAHSEPIYRRHVLPDGRHAVRVAEGDRTLRLATWTDLEGRRPHLAAEAERRFALAPARFLHWHRGLLGWLVSGREPTAMPDLPEVPEPEPPMVIPPCPCECPEVPEIPPEPPTGPPTGGPDGPPGVIPEPGTLGMAGLGLATVLIYRRRRS